MGLNASEHVPPSLPASSASADNFFFSVIQRQFSNVGAFFLGGLPWWNSNLVERCAVAWAELATRANTEAKNRY